MINWSNSLAYNMNAHSWSSHLYSIFKGAPNLLASHLASSYTSTSNKMALFHFSFKQFHKLTWNITFSGLSIMSCCYLKHLNYRFSGFTFWEEKNFTQSDLKTTVHPPEFAIGISSFQKGHFKVVGDILSSIEEI